MAVLTNVMPKRGVFFSLLSAHAERIVGGANATSRLIAGLEEPQSVRQPLIDEVNMNEDSADKIRDQFVELLYQSFTTPFSRDQLHTLVRDLDRVLDTLQSVANAVNVYHIHESTPAARTLASCGADACLFLSRAVAGLGQRDGQAVIVREIEQIDRLEQRATRTSREAITQIFRDEGDEAAAWRAMKLRRLYVVQEAVVDHCRRAAHTIEEILIENT